LIGAIMIAFSLKIRSVSGIAFISFSNKYLSYVGFSLLLLGFVLLIFNEIKNQKIFSKIHSKLDN